MTVRVKIIGRDQLTGKFRRIGVQQLKGAERLIAISGLEVQGEARKSIQRGRKSGRIYVRRGIRHQASAPGQPPATDTGRLASNIFSILDADKLGAEVGTDLRYGRYLEFGTQRMQPRPWLQPAFNRIKPRIRERFARAFRQANKDAAR